MFYTIDNSFKQDAHIYIYMKIFILRNVVKSYTHKNKSMILQYCVITFRDKLVFHITETTITNNNHGFEMHFNLCTIKIDNKQRLMC